MSVDRAKTQHQAQLFASKGQYDSAIAEWKKLAAESPHDGAIHNAIGDLHLKRNANAEAIAAFMHAAEAFRTDGATLKAIAAYKKVLKIEPTRYEIYRHLGDLNAERGLLSSAVQDYLTIGKHYLKEGRGKDALEMYRKIVEQDPTNFDAQQRVAELCIQENQQDEATKVYLQLGRERSAQGRFDEARDAYLAVLRIDPKNSEAEQFVESVKKGGVSAARPASAGKTQKPSESFDLLGEATRRMNEKQYAGAEAILNQLLTREPGNPQVCQLLARLHLQRGDTQVALGEYRFLAGAALRAQEFQSAESLITEFLAAHPQTVALLELYGELYEAKGDGAAAAQQYAKAVELLLDHPEPGMESLHEELFEKAKALSTDRALIDRLTARLAGEPVVVGEGAGNDNVPHPDAGQPQAAQTEPTADQFIAAGVEPDAARTAAGIRSTGDPSGGGKPAPAAPSAPRERETPIPASIPELCSLVEGAVTGGRYRDAEQLMARWLSQEPNNHEARELLGHVYEAKGDTGGAVLQYARALELLMAQVGAVHYERGLGLYQKVTDLAPSSLVVERFADVFAPQPVVIERLESSSAAAVEAAPSAPLAAPHEAEPEIEVEADAHYTLGVAYKNMGLYQEAIEEFQSLVGNDAYFLDACLMAALCYKEERQFAQAICMLEPVLFDPRCQSAKGQAIRYELGLLYEAEDQWEDAAKTYESIPSFHDVPQRLATLVGRRRPPAGEFRLAS